MILYHGTSLSNFFSIFKDKEISVTSDKNSHYASEGHGKTRRGYVYLTDKLIASLEFGLTCSKNQTSVNLKQFIVVFKIDIPDDEIENDPDEESWASTTVKDARFYRIKRGINYDKEICEMAFFSFFDYYTCYKYIDAEVLDKIKHNVVWTSKEDYMKKQIHLNGDKVKK